MASDPSTAAARVRQAQLARMLGVSRQSINELIKHGKIPIGADGLVDVEEARAAIRAMVHPTGKTSTAVGPGEEGPTTPAAAAGAPATAADAGDAAWSYHTAKTLREAAEAQIARIKLAEMKGELVRKEDVDRGSFEAGRAMRDGLMNCARRLGAIVAALDSPEACTEAIAREHRQLLQSWAKAMGVRPDTLEVGSP